MNKITKLSEMCSDIVVIQGFNHKYKYLIKNRLDLFAIIKGDKLNNIKFMEGFNIKLINKFYKVIKKINITKNLYDNTILFIYEKNGEFFKICIIFGMDTQYFEYNYILDDIAHAPILNEYFDRRKSHILFLFNSYDKLVYDTNDDYKQRLKFELRYNRGNTKYVSYRKYFVNKFNVRSTLFNKWEKKDIYYKFKHITPNSVNEFIHKIDKTIEVNYVD